MPRSKLFRALLAAASLLGAVPLMAQTGASATATPAFPLGRYARSARFDPRASPGPGRGVHRRDAGGEERRPGAGDLYVGRDRRPLGDLGVRGELSRAWELQVACRPPQTPRPKAGVFFIFNSLAIPTTKLYFTSVRHQFG